MAEEVRMTTPGFPFCTVIKNSAWPQAYIAGFKYAIENRGQFPLCWKKGFKLCEIPIVFVDRRAGKSKISRKIIVEAMWVVWKLRLQAMFI